MLALIDSGQADVGQRANALRMVWLGQLVGGLLWLKSETWCMAAVNDEGAWAAWDSACIFPLPLTPEVYKNLFAVGWLNVFRMSVPDV